MTKKSKIDPKIAKERAERKANQLTTFAAKAGISVSYASQLVGGSRVPTLEKAAEIYHRTGRKFGVLVKASDEEAETVARVLRRVGAFA